MDILKDILIGATNSKSGNINLLKNGSNVINFLVCSTFQDFEIERRILQTTIYQKVKHECMKNFGVDVKIIDVNLGLDGVEEMSESYNKNFLEMVQNHGLSDAVNCPIILLGNKYGHPQLPYRIPKSIYDLFKSTIRRNRTKFLIQPNSLDIYYTQEFTDDDNKEGDMVLIDIKNLIDQTQSSDEILEFRSQWTITLNMLKMVFHQILEICQKDQSIDSKTINHYFVYELNHAVSNIMSNSLESPFEPIMIFRDIVDIKTFIGLSNNQSERWRQTTLSTFIDTKFNLKDGSNIQLDSNNQILLDQLKSVLTVQFHSPKSDDLRVLWRDPSGIHSQDHQAYLSGFESKMTAHILEAVAQRANHLFIPEPYPDISELVTFDLVANAQLQVSRLHKLYCGFEELISTTLRYIDDSEHANYPMLIYGPPNSGKGIIVAKVFHEVQKNPKEYNHYHPIIRYANSSISAESLLLSILHQICSIEDIQGYNSFPIDNIIDLLKVYSDLSSNTHNFLIIIHDFEKCFIDDDSIPIITDYIPNILPENIKLIITTTNNWDNRNKTILNLLSPEFTSTEYHNFLHSQSSQTTAFYEHTEIYQKMLETIDDILTANIMIEIFKNHFHINSLNELMPFNKNQLIKYLINEIMANYNSLIIIHFLSFLYYSKSGLTDSELLFLLTLDNDVINELYIINPNSIISYNGYVSFPIGILLKLKQEFKVFLIETMIDGNITNKLVSLSIFDEIINNENNQSSLYYHKILSNYYLGNLYNKTKEYFDSKIELKPILIPQNMMETNGIKKFYNYRKFRESVLHLVNSGVRDELLKEIIFNFDWLYNKIKAFHIDELLNDFELSSSQGKEITLLEESLRNSSKVISQDTQCLAAELIGQLLPYVPYYPNLKYLIENCDTIAPKHNAFIPIYPSDKLPGSALTSTISCPCNIESVGIFKNDSMTNNGILLKLKEDFRLFFYDLNQKQISSELLLSHGSICMGQNEQIIVVLESKYKQVIKIHDAENGKLLGQIIPLTWIVSRPFEQRHRYRIQQVDVGKTKIAILITNEVSYLFLVDIESFKMIFAYSPGMKLEMLKLSSDEKTLYTHKGEKLISFNIESNELVSAVELEGLPIEMKFFDENENKGLIICQKQKWVVVVGINENVFENKCYKISFSNCLEADDYVLEVTCSEQDNPFLLIRSKHNVLLYDWKMEKVLCHVTRPSKLPIYFKLPNQHENQPTSLQFNAAKLILNDRAIACALFRDIIICGVGDNRVLTTLHAPVGGIVSNIFVTDQYLIGQIDLTKNKAELMIWRTDINSLFSRLETSQDKLTCSVKKICAGYSKAIGIGENSDEMGVFDVSSGTLVDLYSHAATVSNCVLSTCGKWALVNVNSENNANILWSLESRKIIFEFGAKRVTEFILKFNKYSSFLIISNFTQCITEPFYYIIQIDCNDKLNDIDEQNNKIDKNKYLKQLNINNLGFIINEPMVIDKDKILIFLCRYYDDSTNEITKILIWSRNNFDDNSGESILIDNDFIKNQTNLNVHIILSIHSHKTKCNEVFVLIKLTDDNLCLLILNCENKIIYEYIVLNKMKQYYDASKLIISNNGLYCFDEYTGSLYDLKNNGEFINQLWYDKNDDDIGNNSRWRFHCFAECDSVLIGSVDCTLFAWRLPGCAYIGRSEMRSPITYGCIKAKKPDSESNNECSILMIGCSDGAVLAQALVDINNGNYEGDKNKTVYVERNFPPAVPDSPTVPLTLALPTTNAAHHHDLDNIDSDAIILPKRPFSDPVYMRSDEFSYVN